MKDRAYLEAISELRDGLPTGFAKKNFDIELGVQTKSPLIQYGFSIWLGGLGVDRFRIGQWKVGFIKLAAGVLSVVPEVILEASEATSLISLLGLFGFVQIVDWFLIGKGTRNYNIIKARQIAEELKP